MVKHMTKEEYIKYLHFIQNVNRNKLLDEVDYIYIFALAHTEGDISKENLEQHYKEVVSERQREENQKRVPIGDSSNFQRIRFNYNTDDLTEDMNSDSYLRKLIKIEEERQWLLLAELN